jgi:ABC-2 type transport system permease protein
MTAPPKQTLAVRAAPPSAQDRRPRRTVFFGLRPVARKEFTHILRDPTTLFFALLIPILQLFLFGYAVDTNVRQVPTVIFDESHTQQSRTLIQAFAASDIFHVTTYVQSTSDMYATMRSGKAQVAIRIPFDYARNLQLGTTASVLVLVDGSDSSVASIAVDASTGIALEQSLAHSTTTSPAAIEVRPSVLYNPATRSANFFIPGLIAILLQVMIILLIALSLVRERERGTLEQLKMTPIAPLGLMVGKMIPYGALAFSELCLILAIMRFIFQVPIHGSVILLLLMSLPFLLTVLGIGLIISTRARTQAEAFQLAMGTILPSVFLSGYIFQISNMPAFFRAVSAIIPATYYIQVIRGIVLRGSSFPDLWLNALVLTLMGTAAIALATYAFVKQNAV